MFAMMNSHFLTFSWKSELQDLAKHMFLWHHMRCWRACFAKYTFLYWVWHTTRYHATSVFKRYFGNQCFLSFIFYNMNPQWIWPKNNHHAQPLKMLLLNANVLECGLLEYYESYMKLAQTKHLFFKLPCFTTLFFVVLSWNGVFSEEPLLWRQ